MAEEAVSSLVASYESTLSQVSVKAVGSQVALMTGISLATVLAFSFFRPREKKVYAPKIKYQLPRPADPADDPDYEPPPPAISNGFFAWFSPVIHLKEEQMIANIGLDATTFLRFLRMLRSIFSIISVLSAGLLVVNIIYNIKYVKSSDRNALSLLTIQNVKGSWMWPALAASYAFNFVVMYFVWRNWRAMVMLRRRWFRSPAYQSKIYSRTLMVTQVRKDYRSDQGLLALMGLLKVDGIKIGPEIDCTSIGRRLEDFPQMVKDHNDAVKALEEHLVKYLKGDQIAKIRPSIQKGGFLGMGGEKKDAIDYHAKEIKYLRDKIDAKRQVIDSLLRKERHARKGNKPVNRIEGENYGFVTFKTIAEAHRIARSHQGKLKELFGAQLHLAPMPHDIVWQNIPMEPAEIASRRTFGFVLIGITCFFNTLPLLVVSVLANLSALTVYVSFLRDWQNAGQWGNWTFSLISGVLPSVVSAVFGYLLPLIMRKISRYQGAPTRSRLDRAVTARYFFFMIVSNLIIFSLLGVVYTAVAQVVVQIGRHQSASVIFKGLRDIPDKIQGTYVQQSTYWLTWLPLRGFLVIFELIQLIKLALVSLRRFMFSHTPRDIRDMTKPGYFEYAIIIVNLLFIATVGLIYAPLAPLVAIGACCVFWFSSIVYKYQLLYVYISRAESGGRMWNVYVNRLLSSCILMQLLMVLTTGLIRSQWLDCIAAAPPVLIVIGFKIYLSRTFEQQFRYYEPSPQEFEQEKVNSMSEKRTRHSEMEKRFLHPALQHDKLYTVMVHKSQETLAREVLSAYPWFAGKHERDGVVIKAVREENLEYDPSRDGPRDEAHQAEWDARSITSTDMLGGKSEFSSRMPSPGPDEAYKHYPIPDMGLETPPAFGSNVDLPLDNPSTDHLLEQPHRAEDYRPQRKASRPYPKNRANLLEDPVASSPLLDYEQSQAFDQVVDSVPYPPSAYNQPPIGYTPPTMRRAASNQSEEDIGATRWDHGDIEERGGQASQGYSNPYNQGWDDHHRRNDGDRY
ncbi:hypothetical protein CI109_105303 [Kwoniella shandongensis]|uniref:Uncharacterized protein n=1 Tax=Kwoniella shandongensis TaxID=1734106 RepID=A0A5M6BUQ3_9TREE|nr:uncharacterized protein CI109_004986 [Kwoniella shandongensis]KAA5526596.1 hypothetical protein CI109_004986 [Kwoniella shandongensis]